MARLINRLSSVTLTTLPAGRHADGRGLYLSVSDTGARSWVVMWKRGRKRTEMGAGALADVSLAEARVTAREVRRQLRAGKNPLAERDSQPDKTFGETAADMLAEREGAWRNPRHRGHWRMTLLGLDPKGKPAEHDYCKAIRAVPVAAIDTTHVLQVLRPIWLTKPETASRIRARIERVLDYAKAHRWREGENPARWRGNLKVILPEHNETTKPVKHHAAMPYDDIPAFMTRLRTIDTVGARALEFLILTAARSIEATAAEWSEIKWDAKRWDVPAARMKMAEPHQVPLAPRAVEILRELQPSGGRYVFAGLKRGKPVTGAALARVLGRLKIEATTHGFRSSFRDWCGDRTSFPRELAEHALAHQVGDDTERAYRRNAALERRRELMHAWADFCCGKSNVIQLAERA